ncbi:MAG: hypothetical protein WC775_00805 [Patescibacteria group bacterium]|jgi:predicted GH43/DUF377 family glycosyl hydrolase
MLPIKRYLHNPILLPDKGQKWEEYSAFNGAVIKVGDQFHILYRAMSEEMDYHDRRLRLSSIGHAVSRDGIHFTDREQFIKPELEWERYGCEDPRTTYFEGKYYTFYTAISSYPPDANGIKVGLAISDDMKTVTEKHPVTPFNAKAMVLLPERINGKITVLLTVNTDLPPAHIAYAQFDKIEDLWSDELWHEWYLDVSKHRVHLKKMKKDQVEVGAVPVKTEFGWLFVYSYISNYFTGKPEFKVEAAMLDTDNISKVIAIAQEPLLKPEELYELEGTVRNVVFPTGAVVNGETLFIYYGAADTSCCLATVPLISLLKRMSLTHSDMPRHNRYVGNPILLPKPWHAWEAKAVSNAGVVRIEEETFILYRGLSEDNTSSIGCAITRDGIHIDERFRDPIYVPRMEFEKKQAQNVGSGCEDPRLTRIDDTVYMCYTAYDGVNNPRVALTSILVDDLKNRKWIWTKPQLVSPPGIDDKDACLFPEKINGKFVFMHRIEPDIVLDYVDKLDFSENKWLQIRDVIPPRRNSWDSIKIGISAPPIKSKDGWVLFYHGINLADHEYRVGVMLLDLSNPGTVLSRSEYPLMEPETEYEKNGIVNNVVFPCGVALQNDTAYIYYGAADKVVCLSTIDFPALVAYLKEGSTSTYLLQ